MTDEQFDRDLHATLDKLMAEKAPATLRARVERTLADGDGSRAASPRRRLAWLGAAIAATGATGLDLAAGFGCNHLVNCGPAEVGRRFSGGCSI